MNKLNYTSTIIVFLLIITLLSQNVHSSIDNIIKENTDILSPKSTKKNHNNNVKYNVILKKVEEIIETIEPLLEDTEKQENKAEEDKEDKEVINTIKQQQQQQQQYKQGYEIIRMTNNKGVKFDCLIPKPKIDGSEEWEEIPTISEIAELFEALDDVCIFKNTGWWTYEFCFNKYIRQMHLEKQKILSEYFLGKQPYKNNKGEIKGMDKEFMDAYMKKEVKELPEGVVPYYVELYDDGTTCDILNAKRITEIRYYCSLDQSKSHYIQEILEPSSCTYTLKIYTPFMCAIHPLFIPKQDTILNIQCSEAIVI